MQGYSLLFRESVIQELVVQGGIVGQTSVREEFYCQAVEDLLGSRVSKSVIVCADAIECFKG